MADIGLYEAMSTLRAVRRLRPDPIPDDVLERVLHAAALAPSGGNQQPWRVVVVTDPELKQGLADLYGPEWARFVIGYEAARGSTCRRTSATDDADPCRRQPPRRAPAGGAGDPRVLLRRAADGDHRRRPRPGQRHRRGVDLPGRAEPDVGVRRRGPRLHADDAALLPRGRGQGTARSARAVGHGGAGADRLPDGSGPRRSPGGTPPSWPTAIASGRRGATAEPSHPLAANHTVDVGGRASPRSTGTLASNTSTPPSPTSATSSGRSPRLTTHANPGDRRNASTSRVHGIHVIEPSPRAGCWRRRAIVSWYSDEHRARVVLLVRDGQGRPTRRLGQPRRAGRAEAERRARRRTTAAAPGSRPGR